jgi:outer membrane protein assembly factor BamB
MTADLVWTNKVASGGIYATPLITQLAAGEDNARQLIIPSFKSELQVLDHDGHVMPGWPVVVEQEGYFHTSPALLDFNADGIMDIFWASVNGHLYIVNGEAHATPRILWRARVPKLRVRKHWYGSSSSIPSNETAAAKTQPSAAGGRRRRLLVQSPMLTDQLGDGLTEEGRESLNLFAAEEDDDDDKRTDFDDFAAEAYPVEKDWVYVDAHVLATPALVDCNGDGRLDAVLSVSYFYDEDEYLNHPHLFKHVGVDVDITKYVAGGIVVFDMHADKVLWSEHLDLTTDQTELRAYIYSAPTVVDLDGDGDLEIIVGTSLGLIYALRAATGATLSGFPITMSEIQGQVAVADVTGDGRLDIVAADAKGNVLCFNKQGAELWNTRISGFSAQTPSIGDIDGDGTLDIVIGTTSGIVWALRGDTGHVLPKFPLRTNGRIIAPITLVNLRAPMRISDAMLHQAEARKGRDQQDDGLHLVFPSFDGHIYVVDGSTACTNKIDIGEHSYGMVLADDLLGNGKMDLIATTMNGNVFCFATDSAYRPLKAWRAQNQFLNGFAAQDNYLGIFVSVDERNSWESTHVLGASFVLSFEIVDKRPATGAAIYHVNVTHGARALFAKTYSKPGVYHEHVPSLEYPAYAVLQVAMTNEHRQYFVDTVAIAFNVRYYRTLKWLLVLPFVGMFAALVALSKKKQKTERLD